MSAVDLPTVAPAPALPDEIAERRRPQAAVMMAKARVEQTALVIIQHQARWG